MRALALPYPLLVGRVRRGGVVEHGARPAARSRAARPCASARTPARRARRVEAAVAAAGDGASSCAWTGGQFASARPRRDHPFARLVRAAVGAELGAGARRSRRALGRRHAAVRRARHPVA